MKMQKVYEEHFSEDLLNSTGLHRDTTLEEKYPIMGIRLDLTRELILRLQLVLRF